MLTSDYLCKVWVFTAVFLCSLRWLLVTASVPSSPILVTLMKEALSSSETSVLTRATWRNIPGDTILHYYLIWVYTEARTLLRAVMTDFFFSCWCLEISSDNRIRHVPGCVYNRAQNFRLEAF
jgi:hypothetical protein